MPKIRPLTPEKLRAFFPAEKIPFQDSGSIQLKALKNGRPSPPPPQPRALQAMELGLHIRDRGYNFYVAGGPNLGRTYLVTEFLTPRALKSQTPPDILYAFDFEEPDRPRLLFLPAGQGRKLKNELSQALSQIKKEIPVRFETDASIKKRRDLLEGFDSIREKLVGEMESGARKKGFNLNMDEQGGLTLYPLVEGKLLSEDEFERLDPDLRKKLKKRSDELMKNMSSLLREINREEQGFREKERGLDREIVKEVLQERLTPLAGKFPGRDRDSSLAEYFQELRKDILDNLEQFIPKDSYPAPAGGGELAGLPLVGALPFSGEDFFVRYELNLFVDNADTKGAPIVIEDHPTVFNLLGTIEREAEMGALVTDLTLIKPGALHKAHQGFLILHMEDLLQNPQAWEGLLRALRSGQARIEDPGEGQDQTRTKTIEPEPLKLQAKVILIGTDDMYETLLTHDDRFSKLFKIKAHLQESVHRNAASVRGFCHRLARIIDEAGLLTFERDALARLVDFGSRLAEDQKKISLKFPLVRELMIEASAMAAMRGKPSVDREVLARAEAAREYRSNLYEEEFMEEYDRELIKVSTSGTTVGRANGLSVTWFGDYEFGLPHQIACTVGVGHGGIIDLEREAELGGPIHTKAMMILKSYLISLFAQDKPLVLTGSLCFEQSYAHVEGDSASGAELAALLSALSGVPIKLSLAFTGAVNQSGAIMAVGGVSRKIEGFFQVCRRHGLTGEQGVLIPEDNKVHLMLSDEVVEAVKNGMFQVYPVKSIEQAMELLTGLKAGARLKRGGFSRGSIYDLVDNRLSRLAVLAESEPKKKRGGRKR